MYLMLSELLSPALLHVAFILYDVVLAPVVMQGKFCSILKFSNLTYFVTVLLILALITCMLAVCHSQILCDQKQPAIPVNRRTPW